MMEPIRLWSDNQGDSFGDDREGPDDVEYAALTRADFDALIAQRDGATARADALAALLKEAKEKMTDRDTFPVCLDAAIFVFLARIDAELEKKK